MRRQFQRGAWLASVVLLAGGLAACGAKEECDSTTVCSRNVEACCTDSSCYYEYSGTRVNCNGTNCDAAANRVAAEVCGGAVEPGAVAKLSSAADVLTLRSACEALP
jgi:hypothetical protein